MGNCTHRTLVFCRYSYIEWHSGVEFQPCADRYFKRGISSRMFRHVCQPRRGLKLWSGNSISNACDGGFLLKLSKSFFPQRFLGDPIQSYFFSFWSLGRSSELKINHSAFSKLLKLSIKIVPFLQLRDPSMETQQNGPPNTLSGLENKQLSRFQKVSITEEILVQQFVLVVKAVLPKRLTAILDVKFEIFTC